jgi:hypothetical protein
MKGTPREASDTVKGRFAVRNRRRLAPGEKVFYAATTGLRGLGASREGRIRQEHDMSVGLSGKWHNQYGSMMDVTVTPDGRMRGKYRTGVGSPNPSEEFDLSGFVSGNLVAFSVRFDPYPSLTSWVGQHAVEDGVEKLHTMWHMVVDVRKLEKKDRFWYEIHSGSDVFLRGTYSDAAVPALFNPSHPLK